jgi:hypothetical protein
VPDDLIDSFPVLTGGTTDVTFLTVGASNVHAFIGMNGPYWTDLDGSQGVSWAFNTGVSGCSEPHDQRLGLDHA